eukprot:CAMPEP_0197623492 /NCGR_PEP_ID=MMETSP1338-20131121/3491_1 /TAXON_ID=43686 ORGANISM="Pelagodinium beii, Strain RCC1491" /NCGR_SAMPLE_ID=MMETSP1338 /ASSEMBLY_ACC=CAM_ASM_000754 /LENGTH=179 /DNA_ID=CAMNT_0043193481 /DNA_START=59 /DNA_END=598 /DNA_ORIENTATION=-
MPVTLYQQGSGGALRDLDYINPRPPKQSSALPPDVRARLLGKKVQPQEAAPSAAYVGAANAEPKKGKSGAGTDWVNPNGHAFVRKGSGVPLSMRASRAAQLSGAAFELIKQQSQPKDGGNSGGYPAPLQKKKSSTRIGYADEGYARQRQSRAELVSAELLQAFEDPSQSAHNLDVGGEA